MRKLFLSIAVFVMALCANAQTNQYFWYQGNLMLGTQIAQIDSVTFGNSESVDTLHLLLPRTIIKTVHDTVLVAVHDTVYIHDCAQSIEESKTEYLWLEGNQDFLINWNNNYCNIEYSLDKTNWLSAKPTASSKPETFTQIPANTKVYLRGVNGSNNSFYGSDWWGFMRVTTDQLYNSPADDQFCCHDCMGTEIKTGGNILSIVFGDSFAEHSEDVVYSTLSAVFYLFGSMLTDASLLYFAPAEYGTNTGWLTSYTHSNQSNTFAKCFNLQKGPYIKYLFHRTFAYCESLTDIYYIGDGSEITEGNHWFYDDSPSVANINSMAGANVKTLTIHVKPGVTIPYKPANAVVVEDIPANL